MDSNTANDLWWNKLFVILPLLLSGNSFSQWDVYTVSNSPLMSNNIRCLENDTSGFFWIGTDNGLYAFDGSSWLSFHTNNSGLGSNQIRSLYKDGDSVLWVGTFDAGVFRYDGSWSSFHTGNSGLSDNFVRDVTRLPDSSLYFATAGGLSRYKNGIWNSFNSFNSSLWSNHISSVVAWGSKDSLFFGSINGGLNKFTDTIYVYNSYNTNLNDNTLLDIDIDENNTVWCATPSGGLVLFNPQNNLFFSYMKENSLSPSNSYNQLFLINSDSIYLTSIDAGLVAFINGVFTSVSTLNSNLPDNHTTAVLKIGNQIILGTQQNGLAVGESFVNGLSEDTINDYNVTFSENNILIKSLFFQNFYLFSAEGRLIASAKGKNISFSTIGLSSGVYIVKSENGVGKKITMP